jgi:ribosome modulation factor
MTTLEKIEVQGWNAFFANETAEVCPHKFGTAQCFAWLRGHRHAEEELERVHGPNGAQLLPMEPLARS